MVITVKGYDVIRYLIELNKKEKSKMAIERKFFIAGVQHRVGAVATIKELMEGDLITLKPEPENKYDSNAIAIYSGGDHIGYVPKKFSAEISAAMEIEELGCVVTLINQDAKSWEMCQVEVRSVVEDKEEFDYGFGDEGMDIEEEEEK